MLSLTHYTTVRQPTHGSVRQSIWAPTDTIQALESLKTRFGRIVARVFGYIHIDRVLDAEHSNSGTLFAQIL